ncbi:MAG TPA: PilN domain-containing protein [Myxococcota bacterium]|nr:PilN domain-containing protein [Myxococcota bacterium]HRY95130.1 PilN domain-containing protein [Myxococcota bacterium]
MIRINLLPIKAARKQKSVKQQMLLFAILLLGGGIAMYFAYDYMEGQLDQRRRTITQTQQQIEQYQKAIGEVEKFKGLEEQLNRKLAIIESLIKGKTGPVRVLDRISALVPKQVWLTSWHDKGGLVILEGEAISNKWVSTFVTALKESREAPSGPAAAAPAAPAVPAAPAPAVPGQPAPAPVAAPGGLSFFSNIQIVMTETYFEKDAGKNFVKFKLTMTVNYAI